MLDWCLLHRRDTPLSGINELFRGFVMEHAVRDRGVPLRLIRLLYATARMEWLRTSLARSGSQGLAVTSLRVPWS